MKSSLSECTTLASSSPPRPGGESAPKSCCRLYWALPSTIPPHYPSYFTIQCPFLDHLGHHLGPLYVIFVSDMYLKLCMSLNDWNQQVQDEFVSSTSPTVHTFGYHPKTPISTSASSRSRQPRTVQTTCKICISVATGKTFRSKYGSQGSLVFTLSLSDPKNQLKV